MLSCFFFFFQAEDGIRDIGVTGVQTCALPIFDGSFWAANEFANTEATANWGTAIANFTISNPLPSTDMAVTASGPSSITAGANATYTITITNNGPSPAQGVVLSDTLPAGSVFVSMTRTTGADTFSMAQSG